MEKVYLISRGSYSDYSVVGAFSTKEKAEQFIKEAKETEQVGCYQLNDEIEELGIDCLTTPKGLHPYTVYFNKEKVISTHPSYVEEMQTVIKPYGYAKQLSCWAKDEQHATKIANEIRVQLIALNQWEDNAKSSS